MTPTPQPILMDCTIRDGNYAVDFKFTEADTGLITARLAQLGVNWIEVGHGLGLGAMEAGKGNMPARDEDLIRAARSNAGKAKIGAFFIPGIGTADHLRMARDAGLDFVRLGSDVDTLERTFPYIEQARSVGLTVCVNMMKTYVVTPEHFAQRARQAAEAGAQVVYCVDSAGCMTPEEVAAYFAAAAPLKDCQLGFHGHNNLMLAVANCLAAYRHGATFLDTTICGLGRSAGNAPTEIMVALLHKMGIETGIDLFSLMDFTEAYVWPLVARQRAHDMMAVTIGYSSFHSSFLPKVARSAAQHQVEVRRLVAQVAGHSLTQLDLNHLEVAAASLPRLPEANPTAGSVLTNFDAPSLSNEKISTSLEAVRLLIEGMTVAAAKQPNLHCALHLVAHPHADSSLVVPEFLLQRRDTLLARITYGDYQILAKVLNLTTSNDFHYLVEESPGWAADALQEVSKSVAATRCLAIQSLPLRSAFLLEVLRRSGQRFGRQALLVYGADAGLINILQGGPPVFSGVYFLGSGPEVPTSGGVRLSTHEDWSLLGLSFNLVLCAARPSPSEAAALRRALTAEGKILCLSPMISKALTPSIEAERILAIDLNGIYASSLEQLTTLEDMLGTVL